MKKLFLTLALSIGIFTLTDLSAQIFVRIRPIAPVVIVKPPLPSPRHIWIDGEWRWNKKRGEYVWREGFWIEPKPGRMWVPGFWEDGPGGSRWIAGHWKRMHPRRR